VTPIATNTYFHQQQKMSPTDHLEEPDAVQRAKQHQTDDSEPSETKYVATMETSVAENPKSSNGKILPFVVGGTKQTFAQQLKSIEDQVQLQKLQLEEQEQQLDDQMQEMKMVDQFQN
jgi:tRNA A37 N6-isopentenylltransferase MiaA